MNLGQLSIDSALAVLRRITAHPRHRFWPDALGYGDISWRGVVGHRQVTDAYLAALARHFGGKLVSFDRQLSPQQEARAAIQGADCRHLPLRIN